MKHRALAAAVALVLSPLTLGAPAFAQTSAATAARPSPRPATIEIRETDLVADYFAADHATASPGAVIVLGGSEGRLGGARTLARRLSAEGFDAIAVSYFGEPGQSARLDRIPIEPVGRARAWLEARPGRTGRIAVVGVSKGAELALVSAARDPGLGAVVAGVPTHLVWQGIDQSGGETGSSWTEGGQPLAYTPYDMTRPFTGILDLYQRSLDVGGPQEAEIPVERINGPVMLVSGGADTLWPSAPMADRIEARLKAHDFRWPVANLVYPEAGHAVFGPPVAADAPGVSNVVFVGGTVEALVAARADAWPRVVAFLRQSLAE